MILTALLAALALSGAQPPKQQAVDPPEEDASLTRPTEYTLNPLQAERELRTGDYYRKKGSWKAAALRYHEATLWNPMLAEAWLKLGEARERIKEAAAARAAYAKFLELSPDAKNADEIRKKLKK